MIHTMFPKQGGNQRDENRDWNWEKDISEAPFRTR